MRVPFTASAFGMAVVLLGTACSGQPKGAVRAPVSDDPVVRSDAAIRLGQVRSKEAVDALIAALNDQEETVRVNVIRALGDIGDPKAIAPIVPFVAESLSAVRMAACQALGALRDARGVPGPESLEVLLRVALQDESERIRSHVVKVVGTRRTREAVPRLESALRAESDMVRANAAMALGEIGDPFYKVRCLAVHAIAKIAPGRLGDRSGMETIRTLLFKGEPEDVRAEAIDKIKGLKAA